MNWFFLIPVLCGVGLLLTEPLTFLIAAGGALFILAGSLALHWVFEPRKK